MLSYYASLAQRGLRKNKILTALVIVAIALGIGASMTSLTVLHHLSGDPMPGKSQHIYRVQLDVGPMEGYRPGAEPEKQVTRFDAEALVREGRADRQAMMTGGNVAIESERPGLAPFYVDARYTSADFFSMFQVPFAEGHGWTASEDEARAQVAVIARPLADKLFGAQSAIGQSIHANGHDLRVIGVTDDWNPAPHFYDLNTNSYGEAEQVFIPFSTSRELDLNHNGTMNCWGNDFSDPRALDAPCVWIQLWVQLGSAEKASSYRAFLERYSREQQGAGRFARAPNVRLRNVMQWLDFNEVVPSDVRLQTWLAFAFLAVCLINAVGLLLAKFLRRSAEIGIRRALGAPKGSIFAQLIVEAGAVGLLGGLAGLALVQLGLWAVRQQPTDYARLATLDSSMFITTFALALIASILAGVLPAWRACKVTPALQIKAH